MRLDTGVSQALRRAVIRDAIGIGIACGAYAISFGAVAVATGLSPWQAQVLSLGMFTGASQFALVGVLGAGGGVIAAVLTACLLGMRNGLYAMALRPQLRMPLWQRPLAAQATIDESTAMATAQTDEPTARLAFWWTAGSIFVLWNLGTLLGALGAAALPSPEVLGLDAAIPAAFLALLWPRLRSRQAWVLAVTAAVVALALTPVLSPGLPVLSTAGIAILVALRPRRTP
jgi:predicted branched-subunit amino acid permease